MGERDGVLKGLISAYKFHSARAAADVLAEMLRIIIDQDYTVVPLPTIRRHIRERGFDHIGLIARRLGMPVEKVLQRKNNSVQVGASQEERERQAAEAYEVVGVDPNKRYLLLDDVWTTGSSMKAACEVMRGVGIKNLAIGVIARSV